MMNKCGFLWPLLFWICLSSSEPLAPQVDSIFSATILKFFIRQRFRDEKAFCTRHAAIVSVRRVFRGSLRLRGRRVVVEDIPRDRALSIGDTRIFFVNNMMVQEWDFPGKRMLHFHLRKPPIRVTLPNLRNLWGLKMGGKRSGFTGAFVVDHRRTNAKQQHTRLQFSKTCDESNPCPFGGVCVTSEDQKSSECRCEDTCPYAYTPVCGSDQVTYDNECKLKLSSCRKKKNIKQIHSGVCGINSCMKLSCPQYSKCVPSFDGSSAKCVCPEPCENTMNHTSIVCGSDGRDYPSECHLKRTACQNRVSNLEVRYKGRCNPCGAYQCDALRSQECRVEIREDTNERDPKCACNSNCPDNISPVCASNGLTYRNECLMKLDGCRRFLDLHIVYQGDCSKGINPCKLLNCNRGQRCEITKQGITNCVCPKICEPIVRPICGSDKITYENLCSLKKSACKKRKEISPIYYGMCGSNGPCTKRKCNHNSICVESDDIAFCECPTCETLEYNPVCGTNGKTYGNACLLSRDACLKEDDSLSIGDLQLCSGCSNITCDFYGFCHDGACQCPTSCDESSNYGKICGTDGKTYSSECAMMISACNEQKNVALANIGECDLCRGIKCKHGARCVEGACVCPTDCPRHEEPLCGSDYRTYINECEMLKASCKESGETQIKFLHHGSCRSSIKITDTSSKPCYGKSPLVDPITDVDYKCGEVVGERDCPANSYCHKTARFAKCCLLEEDEEIPECDCSEYGSENLECNGGKCRCKSGIHGDKCDVCPGGEIITERGCDGFYLVKGQGFKKCGSFECTHGAVCVEEKCTCDVKCTPDLFPASICGSDGKTYDNECQLLFHICRSRENVFISQYSPCQEPSVVVIKSTRHITNSGFNYINGLYNSITPTSITVHGLLGDFCIFDNDCSTLHSICSLGKKCVCDEGYKNSYDGRLCSSRKDPGPCSSSPCLGGGTCEEHDGIFTCFCPSTRMGNRCEMELSEHEPIVSSFNGRSSYVELATLEKVDYKFSLSMEFKAFVENGILFYAQQDDSSEGDFISLALVDGFVEFRYNLGDGPAIIRSSHSIGLNSWHKIQAKRWHKDGILKLDSYPDVRSQSPGKLRSLDILTNTFIGGFPAQKVLYDSRNFGTSAYFSGCIREFKIGHRTIKIQSASELKSIKRNDLAECNEAACSNLPCRNGGRCVENIEKKHLCLCKKNFSGPECQEKKDACSVNPCKGGGECKVVRFEPVCDCPPGRRGKLCELVTLSDESALTFVPNFNSKSYIELPTLRHVSKSFDIEVWFLSYQPNGMILYNGQNTNGHGDFLSLNLVNRKVQFRYDLGSGIANLTSKESFELGEWHKVKISRDGPHGSLQLNERKKITGSSYAPLTELNLNLPLYLGGFKFSYILSRSSGIVIGLDGAIQRVSVNGNLIEDLMEHAKDSRRITRFSGPPCNDHNCVHGGLCKPFFRSYTCKCRANYIGKYCEKHLKDVDDKSPVYFNGKTFLKFMNKLNRVVNTNRSNNEIEEDIRLVEWDEEFDSDDDEQIGQIIDDFESDEEAMDIYGRRGEVNNKFTIHLRTSEKNGLLVWTNQGTSLKGDFLAVAIVDGYPELSYKLGKRQKTIRIKSGKRIDDDKWHRVKVIRRRRTGLIQVDKRKPIREKSGTGASILNTNGKVWIGGKEPLPSGLPRPYYRGFKGCIKKVKVFRKRLDLLRSGDNSNVKLCGT